jgi:phenylpropionate dioxygenase-like ring-hydroxylating dioxygenase large terminal subunit
MQSETLPEVAPGVPAGLELGLRNYWYPILMSTELPSGQAVGVRRLGEDLVAWRERDGRPHVLTDRCPHRTAKLSLGRVMGDNLQCAYHGLRFDGSGQCIMMPWEPDGTPAPTGIGAQAYPAEELAGLIWAYLGDVAAFPPPPLRDVVPEEAVDDEYVCYTMTEHWNTNWMLGLDGTDRYHATVLHAETQAVANETWTGGPARPAQVPLEDRRIKLVDTPEGVRGFSIDIHGNPIHTGHVKETGIPYFQLPCMVTNEFVGVPGTDPYRNRLYLIPVDADHTQATRLIGQRAPTPDIRERWAQLYEDVVKPRTLGVSAQDAVMCESQGSLAYARTHEHLLRPDGDVYRMRQQIRAAFLLQRQGKRYEPGAAEPATAGAAANGER